MTSNAQGQAQQFNGTLQSAGHPADPAVDVYREALHGLVKAKVPFLVGGTFALESYTGRVRRTKDANRGHLKPKKSAKRNEIANEKAEKKHEK